MLIMRFALDLLFSLVFYTSCTSNNSSSEISRNDTIYVHDTISTGGSFIYNLPCKVEYIHPEKSGKAILVFWLHGGVRHQDWHDFSAENHMTWVKADEYIINYLKQAKEKAVFIIPICHKANKKDCVAWIDCAYDIKQIIDDYVNNGIVDKNRVYIIGSSDGGAGVWDLAEQHGDWFAAGMPLSCSRARKTSIPMYWHSTQSEGDQTAQAKSLNSMGCKIEYEYHPDVSHGGDEIACKDLSKLLSQGR